MTAKQKQKQRIKSLIMSLIVSIIYFWSFLTCYNDISKDYSKGGKLEHLKPYLVDVVFTVTPLLNTVLAIYITAKNISIDIPYDKFFNIKK
jgi:hypothetical protein